MAATRSDPWQRAVVGPGHHRVFIPLAHDDRSAHQLDRRNLLGGIFRLKLADEHVVVANRDVKDSRGTFRRGETCQAERSVFVHSVRNPALRLHHRQQTWNRQLHMTPQFLDLLVQFSEPMDPGSLLDTYLNVVVFAYIGLLIWLYVKP